MSQNVVEFMLRKVIIFKLIDLIWTNNLVTIWDKIRCIEMLINLSKPTAYYVYHRV